MVDVLSGARQSFLRLATFPRLGLRGGDLFLRAGEISSLLPRDFDLVLSAHAAVDFFGQAHDARANDFSAGRAGRVRLLVELLCGRVGKSFLEVAIKLAGAALRVRVRVGRSAGGSLAEIFRVVRGAKKIYQRNVFALADNFAESLLFFNRREKFFGGGGGQHCSSTFAGGNFLHDCRVDFFVHALSVRTAARIVEKIFECARKEFLLRVPGASVRDNLFGVGLGQARLGDDCPERTDFLRGDGRVDIVRKSFAEKIFYLNLEPLM